MQLDCEVCEWTSLNDMPQLILEKFSQVIIEYHIKDLKDVDHYKLVTSALKKINLTHQAYHIHANNCAPKISYGNFHKFTAIEVSYVLKRNNIFKNDYNLYPINGLDYTDCLGATGYNYGLAGFFKFE